MTQFWGGHGGTSSDLTPKGAKYVWPPRFFLASNTHLATRNPIFQTEIEPECSEKPFFFSLHLNLGAKFRTEIELLSLTKHCKNISPP